MSQMKLLSPAVVEQIQKYTHIHIYVCIHAYIHISKYMHIAPRGDSTLFKTNSCALEVE